MGETNLLIYNAEILSMDKKNSLYQWMAIKDGEIIDIGTNAGYKKYLTNYIDKVNMNGKTIVPGFYDCHVHLVQTGLNFDGLDFGNTTSIKDALELIESKVTTLKKNELIRGIHFDVINIEEKRFPTRHELDLAAPNNPIWINSIEFHTSTLNSLALNIINLPLNIDGIARDERNLPLGYFTGKASALIRNKMLNIISNKIRMKGVKKAVEYAVSKGITSINAVEGGYTFHENDVLFLLENKTSFPIDIEIYYQSFSFDIIADYGLKQIGGDIFIDGSFGSRTAAISENYKDAKNNNGKLYFSQEELDYFVIEAHEMGLQIALHAIGDRAIEQVLNSFELALRKKPRSDHRHRIEHFELATDEQIKRAKEMSLIISVQPAYEYNWGMPGGMYVKRLGEKLANKTNDFKKQIENGLVLCGGSDSDVTEMNPILGIHSAVNHPKKEHSISVIDALKIFTINGAYACFEDEIKGSLEVGKYGDFVVLDKNPLEVDKKEIIDIKVLGTYKEGNKIFCLESEA